MSDEHDLQKLVGQTFPSRKNGCWIVDDVRGGINGRSRLVTANLKGEQWVWTRSLVEWVRLFGDTTHETRAQKDA